MRRWLRRILLGISILLVMLALGIGGGYLWLRTSLAQDDGVIAVKGTRAPIHIARDERGVVVTLIADN